MTAARAHELLAAASEAYADGRDPFSTPWLIEHDVTATECHTLGGHISVAIETFVGLQEIMADKSHTNRTGAMAAMADALVLYSRNHPTVEEDDEPEAVEGTDWSMVVEQMRKNS